METETSCPSSPKSLTCHLCDRSFTMRRLYERHLQMHTNGFDNAHSDFYNWENDSNDMLEYRCFLCDRVFSTLKGMKGHMTRMHPGEKAPVGLETPVVNGNDAAGAAAIAVCDLCGSYFDNKEGLMTHLVDIHGTTIVKPEPVGETMTNGQSGTSPAFVLPNASSGIDLDEAGQTAEHHCCLCRRDFSSAHALNVHVSQAHGSGGSVPNGASHHLQLPIVTKGQSMDDDGVEEVEDDEEETMRVCSNTIASIKQEVVPNVKSEIIEANSGPALTGPALTGPAISGPALSGPVLSGDPPGGLVISNVFSLNAGRPVLPGPPPVAAAAALPLLPALVDGAPRRRTRANDSADYVHLCKFCGKGYAHPSNKFRHQRVCPMREAVESGSATAPHVSVGGVGPVSMAPPPLNFECVLCRARFANQLGLNVHMKKMHAEGGRVPENDFPPPPPPVIRERRYFCCDCGARYAMMCNLCCHRKRSCPLREEAKEAVDGWRCFLCKAHFASVTAYLQHGLDEPTHCRIHQQPPPPPLLQEPPCMPAVHPLPPPPPPPVTRQLRKPPPPPPPQKPLELPDEERPWPCTPCGKFFRFKSELNEHRQVVHGLGPYLLVAPSLFFCPACDRQFRYRHHLSRHMRAAHADREVHREILDAAAAVPVTAPASDAPVVLSLANSVPSLISAPVVASSATPIVTISTSVSPSNIKGLSCEDCGIAFSTRRLLVRHMERVHKVSVTSPPIAQSGYDPPPQQVVLSPPVDLTLPPNLPDSPLSPSMDLGDMEGSTIWINGQQAFLCNRDECRRVFSTKNGLSVHLYRAHIRPALEQQQQQQHGGEEEGQLLPSPAAPVQPPMQPTLPPLSSIFAPLSSIPVTATAQLQQSTATAAAAASSTSSTSSTNAVTTTVSVTATASSVSANPSRIKILPRPANLTKAQVQSSWEEVLVTNGNRCEICNVTFPSPQTLHWHRMQRHTTDITLAPADSGSSTCPIVIKEPVDIDDGVDEDEDDMISGDEEMILAEEVGMDVDGYSSRSRYSASGRRSSPCVHCGKTFRTEAGLKVHITRMHMDAEMQLTANGIVQISSSGGSGLGGGGSGGMVSGPLSLYVCSQCGLQFSRAAELRVHENDVHPPTPPPRPGAGDVDLDNGEELALPLRRTRRETTSRYSEHRCNTCGRGFSNLSGLKVHLKKMHSRDDPVPVTTKPARPSLACCPYCLKDFDSTQSLKLHIGRSHGNMVEEEELEMEMEMEELEEDEVRSLGEKLALDESGEPPFVCELCDRVFRNRMGLSTHQRSHGGKAPTRIFGCERCLQRFTKWCNMISHQKISCPVKLGLYCPYCDERFDVGLEMYAHISGLHAEAGGGVSCPKCSEHFDSPTKVREHLSLVHVPLEENADSNFEASMGPPARRSKTELTPIITEPIRASPRFSKEREVPRKEVVSDLVKPPVVTVRSASSNPATPPSSGRTKSEPGLGRLYEMVGSHRFACKLCDRIFNTARAVVGHQRFHRGGHMDFLDSIIESVVEGKGKSVKGGEDEGEEQEEEEEDETFDDEQMQDELEEEEGDRREEDAEEEEEEEDLEGEDDEPPPKRMYMEPVPLICNYCRRSFKNTRALYAHQRSHGVRVPQRRLICSGCGRSFGSKSSLNSHQSWHCLASVQQAEMIMPEMTRATLYSCHLCDATFRQERRLEEHKRTDHAEEKEESDAVKMEEAGVPEDNDKKEESDVEKQEEPDVPEASDKKEENGVEKKEETAVSEADDKEEEEISAPETNNDKKEDEEGKEEADVPEADGKKEDEEGKEEEEEEEADVPEADDKKEEETDAPEVSASAADDKGHEETGAPDISASATDDEDHEETNAETDAPDISASATDDEDHEETTNIETDAPEPSDEVEEEEGEAAIVAADAVLVEAAVPTA